MTSGQLTGGRTVTGGQLTGGRAFFAGDRGQLTGGRAGDRWSTDQCSDL